MHMLILHLNLHIGWDAKRELSKINYKIHTEAVKEFGKTASQWRKETNTKGMIPNIRDYASAEESVVLINLEDTNADLIRQGLSQLERLKILRDKAYRQLHALRNNFKLTGIQLANMYGFTTQNPACIEVCSNEATTKQRKVDIDGNITQKLLYEDIYYTVK